MMLTLAIDVADELFPNNEESHLFFEANTVADSQVFSAVLDSNKAHSHTAKLDLDEKLGIRIAYLFFRNKIFLREKNICINHRALVLCNW